MTLFLSHDDSLGTGACNEVGHVTCAFSWKTKKTTHMEEKEATHPLPIPDETEPARDIIFETTKEGDVLAQETISLQDALLNFRDVVDVFFASKEPPSPFGPSKNAQHSEGKISSCEKVMELFELAKTAKGKCNLRP